MATVYKRTRRRSIPKGAEIGTRGGRKYATWTDKRTKRQRRAPLADDAQAILLEEAHYTIEYFDHDGQRRRVGSKTPDKDAAQRLANQLETGTMERARGLIDPRREQLAGERRRALGEHLADYEAKLRADNCDAKHVASTIGYIKVIAKEAGFTAAKDIQADRVNTFASKLRRSRSARTVQAHLTAIKQFTRWLAVHNKLPSDPLVSVTRPSIKGQRKRERRMLLPDEWEWLRSTTLKEGVIRNDVGARERTLLYCTAIQTGLRSNELRSLAQGRLFLDSDPPYVICTAGSTKNKKECRQYLNQDLAMELRAHVAAALPSAPVLSMPPRCDVPGMLRADLEAARRAWLKAVEHEPAERLRREQSDFLREVNHEGEILDFHALRHTCGGWLAMNGAHPKAVQAVMRHSTITLTMDTYGHLFPGQEAETVARLPEMLSGNPGGVCPPAASEITANCTAGIGQHFGQQLAGRNRRTVADGGEQDLPEKAVPATPDQAPQVVTLTRHKKSRRALAAAGNQAEGMGFEPTTPCGASDFESD